jgi:tRNA threonylcarbamoyladenosine modification (KEOPS) complex Cgi121 subunit
LTEVKAGDTLVQIPGIFVSIILIRQSEGQNIQNILTDIRRELNPNVVFQIINASIIYGLEHLLRTVTITFEAKKRGNIFVRNEEIDLLLRFSYSRRVSDAILFAGSSKSGSACLLLYSKSKNALYSAKKILHRKFSCIGEILLQPDLLKKDKISAKLGIDHNFFDDADFLKYLIERSALVVR